MQRENSPDRIKLGMGVAAAVATAMFLGWRMLGFVEEVWGPEANPFAPRPAIVTPRPIERIKEFAPADGSVVLRDVSYAAGAGDVPGWLVRGSDPVVTAAGDTAAIAPWRGSAAAAWRRPLAGQGNSSPIVVGERIFLTIADGGPALRLVCISLETGTDIWRQLVSREPFPPRHEKTSDAASTPCSDGERVFVTHATADAVHLSAFGLDGRSLWKTRLGPFNARWGFTCSPAWARGLVVVGADNPEEGFLTAVDGETGREVWRRRRPRAGDESYSSPVIVTATPSHAAAAVGAAEPQVVMAGLERIESHALGSGRTLWGTGGLASTSGATPAVAGDICVATSGYPTRAMVALRMDPGGAAPAVLWKEDRDSEVPYVPSPLAHAGRLYVVHDDGMAHCRDLVTGKVVWKRRVGGTFTASPVLVNGELLCADESGRCTLLAVEDGTVQHEFSLAGGCFATPVVVRGRLLVRTTQELVAFDVAAR